MSNVIADLRVNYAKHELLESEVAAHPVRQFEIWFQEALHSDVKEANAMTLATVKNGLPKARIVLLKGIEEGNFVFYTNYDSAKGEELADNSFAALTFFWDALERQVRIEGEVRKVSAETSDAYFQSRPRGSRIGAWVSDQSAVIPNREFLEERLKELEKQYENAEEIPRPPHWGGYAVMPTSIEFWQGRPNRLHDRLRYRLENDIWIIERLSP